MESSYKKELEFKTYEITRLKETLNEKERRYEGEFEALKA
jgi:flagellar capping protein FliD